MKEKLNTIKNILRQLPFIFNCFKLIKHSLRSLFTLIRQRFYWCFFKWKTDKEIINDSENLIKATKALKIKNAINRKLNFINLPTPKWASLFSKGYFLSPYYLTLLEDSEIVGAGGIIVDKEGAILFNSIMNRLRYFEYMSWYPGKVYLRKKIKVSKTLDKAIVLINPISGTYFHWLIEVLPRLIMLQEQEEITMKDLKVVISRKAPPFTKASLKAFFNIPDHNIIYYDDQRLLFKNLYYQSYLHGYSSKHKISLYNDKILNKLYTFYQNKIRKNELQNNNKNEFIIISRKLAHKRRIVNEERLLNELKGFNFKLQALDNVSFEKQIEIFNNARIIIAMHGSALANIIFCEQNTLLIELYPNRRSFRYMNYFYQVSRARNMKHTIIGVQKYADIFLEDIELTGKNLRQIRQAVEEFGLR